jgi:hypothetical protein
MRIRLSDLESARRNPRAFAQGKLSGPTGYRSRYLTLRTVAMNFHAQNDLAASAALLDQRLRKQFKTTTGNKLCMEKLQTYVAAFEALGTSVARVRNNVTVRLPEEYAPFAVSGQVSRLDVAPLGGYRAWLFTNKSDPWRDELRFPLLQLASADQLGVGPEEVIPGVYDFSTGHYTELRYTKQELSRAGRDLLGFLDSLKRFGALKQPK